MHHVRRKNAYLHSVVVFACLVFLYYQLCFSFFSSSIFFSYHNIFPLVNDFEVDGVGTISHWLQPIPFGLYTYMICCQMYTLYLSFFLYDQINVLLTYKHARTHARTHLDL